MTSERTPRSFAKAREALGVLRVVYSQECSCDSSAPSSACVPCRAAVFDKALAEIDAAERDVEAWGRLAAGEIVEQSRCLRIVREYEWDTFKSAEANLREIARRIEESP